MTMKNHQFAFQPVKFTQMIKELKTIHFYNDQLVKLTPTQLFRALLFKAFIEDRSQTLKQLRTHNLMATPTEALDTYLKQHSNLSFNAFYNVALQLLHFHVHHDFELTNPLHALKEIRLPYVHVQNQDNLTTDEVFKAWYVLLNTRTRKGQTYLDDIASLGYYSQFNNLPKPLFINGKAQPVFDVHHLVHDIVYVESPLDNDHDGKRDLLRVNIIRPAETEQGLKVPTLFTASPYDMGVDNLDSFNMLHPMNVPLKHKQPNHLKYSDVESNVDPTQNLPKPRVIKSTTKESEAGSYHDEWAYTLDYYFLARGFAMAFSSGVGSYESGGLKTSGDPAEVISAKSVVEWLAGNRTAFTNPIDHVAITAWWSNHKVAMIGRSYLGTLSTAVATTGVKGLKTCIIEAAISNWYDYYRDHGVVIGPEDCDVLAEYTFSRHQSAGDYHRIKSQWKKQLQNIQQGEDRKTGSYNPFWDARNYLKNVKNIKADLMIVHGLNDYNVKPRNVGNLWKKLQFTNVTKKLILHQGQHIYINNFQSIDFTDMTNLWLSNKLYDVNNDANQLIPTVTVQDNTKPETWHTFNNWGRSGQQLTYYLNEDQLLKFSSRSLQSFKDHLPKSDFIRYVNHPTAWYHGLFDSKPSAISPNRLLYKSAPLKRDITIDGEVKVYLKVKSSQNLGMLSGLLVDYGKVKRLTTSPQLVDPQSIYLGYQWKKDTLKEFKFQRQPTPYKAITEAHVNLQNRHSSYHVDDLRANQFVNARLTFQPTFFHLLKGHQIGLVIYATDFVRTKRGNQKIKYTIDPSQSKVIIPII